MNWLFKINIQGEFFILRHRNISRNTQCAKKMSAIETYFWKRKATPKKFTPHPGSGRGGAGNFEWKPLFLIADLDSL